MVPLIPRGDPSPRVTGTPNDRYLLSWSRYLDVGHVIVSEGMSLSREYEPRITRGKRQNFKNYYDTNVNTKQVKQT